MKNDEVLREQIFDPVQTRIRLHPGLGDFIRRHAFEWLDERAQATEQKRTEEIEAIPRHLENPLRSPAYGEATEDQKLRQACISVCVHYAAIAPARENRLIQREESMTQADPIQMKIFWGLVHTIREDDFSYGVGYWISKRGDIDRIVDAFEKAPAKKHLQWFNHEPEAESLFCFGPVEGNVKQLSTWIGESNTTLKKRNGKNWHIQKMHGRKYRIWFTSKNGYSTVNGKCIAETARNSVK